MPTPIPLDISAIFKARASRSFLGSFLHCESFLLDRAWVWSSNGGECRCDVELLPSDERPTLVRLRLCDLERTRHSTERRTTYPCGRAGQRGPEVRRGARQPDVAQQGTVRRAVRSHARQMGKSLLRVGVFCYMTSFGGTLTTRRSTVRDGSGLMLCFLLMCNTLHL